MAEIPLEIIANCPTSPNCVSTLTEQEEKLMPALTWSAEGPNPLDAIESVVLSKSRTEIVEKSANFIHAVFTSAVFRFKDDVYFYVDSKNKKIHFKSQSRLGYSDMGANRKRMTALSEQILKNLN